MTVITSATAGLPHKCTAATAYPMLRECAIGPPVLSGTAVAEMGATPVCQPLVQRRFSDINNTHGPSALFRSVVVSHGGLPRDEAKGLSDKARHGNTRRIRNQAQGRTGVVRQWLPVDRRRHG